ncbi:MAG: UTP--glucose-1-phosphate uridylyltransferase GalU [Candidatus Gracilibacteria bacterium]|jgi:UTP--glucose-1-phosphate uridylyltransferase|nr:UTP--glucose-1-phosphate uridylyltransferase GalU [Candidatus Gracilibacteria bacterium]
MQKVKKAVFPVAGFGTRFLPFTKATPKEMLPIVDKPVIQLLAEEAANSEIEQIIVVTGRSKRAIEDHFDASFELEYLLEKKNKKELLREVKKVENLAKFIFVRQAEPKGDGDAIMQAKEVIGQDPFCVVFGDDLIKSKKPSIAQILDVFEKHRNCVIGVQEVPKKDIPKFGIVKPLRDGDIFEIEDMVEKPKISEAPSNLAIVGKFVCTHEIFDALKQAKKSPDGELRLIDGFRKLSEKRAIFGKKIHGTRFDTGSKIGFLEAIVDSALDREDLRDDFIKYIKSRIKN